MPHADLYTDPTHGPSVCAPPPAKPAGLDAEALFEGVHWHQSYELFEGVDVPGRNPVETLLRAIDLPRDLSGMRVLDIGAWNGCFSFECERRGAAEVVAYSPEDPEEGGFARLARALGSNVSYIRGSVYEISRDRLGGFDLVLFLGVLYHLRHPLLALDKIREVCDGTMLLETHVIDHHVAIRNRPAIPFVRRALSKTLSTTPMWRQYAPYELNKLDESNVFGPNCAGVVEGCRATAFEAEAIRVWADRAAFRARAVAADPQWANEKVFDTDAYRKAG